MPSTHPSGSTESGRAGRTGSVSERHTRRAVATGLGLVWALKIVVPVERGRDFAYLTHIGGEELVQALLSKRAMEAFDDRIFIWALGRANIRLHPQTVPEAYERAREIA